MYSLIFMKISSKKATILICLMSAFFAPFFNMNHNNCNEKIILYFFRKLKLQNNIYF